MSSCDGLKPSGIVMHKGKKFTRLMQLNSRFCMIVSFILIVSILILFNSIASTIRENGKFNKYVLNIFGESCHDKSNIHNHLEKLNSDDNDDENETVWGNDTIELFKDQLGMTFASDDENTYNIKCRSGEFLISALPGPDEENFPEILWQFFSLEALEEMTIQYDEKKKLTLKAVYTERMASHLNQIFDGLPLDVINDFPTPCYDLKHTKIIGNMSPISFRSKGKAMERNFHVISGEKACLEVRSEDKNRGLRPDVIKRVQQELEIAKAVSILRTSHKYNKFNFVGVYVTSDDKLTPEYYQQAMSFFQRNSTNRSIFMIICDPQIFMFCRETFDRAKSSSLSDVHLMKKSTNVYDFTLMSCCNSTIISNDISVLHALINGGKTIAYKPQVKDDPQFYIPWLISEKMDDWHSIGSNA